MSTVKAWRDTVIIPTYEVFDPEKYPVFIEKRVYQASSGAVYPHPVIEKISDTAVDKEWQVIYIENAYIKLMVIPELGGRIQMAWDKIRERHFVYYNHVIKPALVGLTGPWISGGIEFNWPQHHRPSTYDATDSYIEKNKDGSITVWVSELERMFRTKGMAGFTLHPDKAYVEIKGQLYNRTVHPQTFLWWANPAVAVNDHYQSVFPPDVNAVFDHGKRDVSEFPIAKGEYYKVDYSPGTDISRYKNIPVPTSYMAITSKYDFVGGYENDSKGGLLHVANHHVSPGKKQWTWGNGDFGQAWDRNLTDNDGPYIELMCGVYTDNQPDFSWLQPYEEKSFKQYFMPYYNVGVVKNASKEALINLEEEQDGFRIKVHVTSVYPKASVVLTSEENVLFETVVDLDPANGLEELVEKNRVDYQNLRLTVKTEKGKTLVSWSPSDDEEGEIPEAAKAAKEPKAIDSVEELFLNGLHLEQYRHATCDPTAYYLEALKRQPGDIRCNNAMGLRYLKKAQFEKALPYFDKAIDTLTLRNPNPYDGEAYFNKGVTLNYLGRKEEAYEAFYKACWNAAWQAAGYFNIAQIDSFKGDVESALEHVDKALVSNWHNHKARHLKVLLLRKEGRTEEALQFIEDSLQIDRFNFGVLFEKYKISDSEENLSVFKDLLRDYEHNYIEFALDYAQAGEFETAIELLSIFTESKAQYYPMIAYFKAYFYDQLGDAAAAKKYFAEAKQKPSDYCFPNRLEEVLVLKRALEVDSEDASAAYYLGNFWYANKQYKEAQKCWEQAVEYCDQNAIAYRNLSLLYYNKTDQKDLAKKQLEYAFELDGNEPRLLMELDQFYKKTNVSIEDRFEILEKNLELTNFRDDLYLEYISLQNFRGNHKEALDLIEKRQFHPWEGGEGKVSYQHVNTHVELAKIALKNGEYQTAITHLEAAQVYPHNLGEGKLHGTQENDIFYWLGCAYDKLGEKEQAEASWKTATQGISEPSPAIFYNDQQPDKIFYQGLAFLKLNNQEEAGKRFQKLYNYGKEHMEDEVKLDYFAISLPDLLIWEEDLQVRNKIHCYYLIGLGAMGLQKTEEAQQAFDALKKLDTYHLSAHIHAKMISDFNTVSL